MRRAKYLGAALLLAVGVANAQAPLGGVLAQWDRDEHPDLRAVVVMRHGAVVAERYYNGETADTLHDVRSAGKSITALLAGAAADRGRLSAAGKVGQYWPASQGRAIADATLDNVLTMRSGLDSFDEDPASPGNEDKMDDAADPVAFALAIPRQTAPGTQYSYNSATAYIAGLVIEQATGAKLDDFARKTLFEPLGIKRWQWLADTAGHPKGQGNLSLRALDMARIGQLVLGNGVYDGRRVISAGWIERMIAPHVSIGAADRYADDYGYFWYAKTQTLNGRAVRVHFASGNGGNKIYVVPSRDMVVAITSSAYGKGYGQLRSENILKALLAADGLQ